LILLVALILMQGYINLMFLHIVQNSELLFLIYEELGCMINLYEKIRKCKKAFSSALNNNRTSGFDHDLIFCRSVVDISLMGDTNEGYFDMWEYVAFHFVLF